MKRLLDGYTASIEEDDRHELRAVFRHCAEAEGAIPTKMSFSEDTLSRLINEDGDRDTSNLEEVLDRLCAAKRAKTAKLA